MSGSISPNVEPQTRAFLEKLAANKGPQIYEMSVADARKVFASLQAEDVAKLPADVEDRKIPGGPNGQVSISIYRPKGSTGTLPALMYFCGGGWVLGNRNSHDRLIRELTNGTGAAVVVLNYTPAPEGQYPVQIEEAYTATRWVAENSKEIRIDPSRLAVAGDSVGGNMTIAVTMLAKERGGPKLIYQVLFYPVTDANFDNASYHEFATDHFLTREAMKWFWNHYTQDAAARAKPTASPLRATTEQLRGLPPALVINGEIDVLRDEGEAYARKLSAAGVTVTAVRYHGTIHDFALLNAITDTPAARGAIAQATDTLRRVFAR